jgi:hypothetical protein
MKWICESFESEFRHENLNDAAKYLSQLRGPISEVAKVVMDSGSVFVFHVGEKPEGFRRG